MEGEGGELVPTPKKEAAIAAVKEKLEASTGLVVINQTGLTVPMATKLRSDLRKADARLTVVKNRLTKLALAGTDDEGLSEILTGPKALLFCNGDVPPAVKILAEFAKQNDGLLTLEGSYLEGNVYDQKQTEALADIGSKPELLSQIVGALNSPITGLVFTLRGIISDFVYTLQAVADKQEDAA